MKRIVLAVVAMAAIGLAAPAMATDGRHDFDYGHHHHHHCYYPYRTIEVCPRPVYLPPTCHDGYSTSYGYPGFYYRGRGVSVGIGY